MSPPCHFNSIPHKQNPVFRYHREYFKDKKTNISHTLQKSHAKVLSILSFNVFYYSMFLITYNGNKRRNLMLNRILYTEVYLPLHKYSGDLKSNHWKSGLFDDQISKGQVNAILRSWIKQCHFVLYQVQWGS